MEMLVFRVSKLCTRLMIAGVKLMYKGDTVLPRFVIRKTIIYRKESI